jgi:hypothetical protein
MNVIPSERGAGILKRADFARVGVALRESRI